jgi:TonB-linked SusC/RagA family outer membrane protein
MLNYLKTFEVIHLQKKLMTNKSMKKNFLLEFIKERLSCRKLFVFLKFSSIILIVFALNTNAGIFSRDSKFELSLTNVSIKDVLREIESQSEITFLYNNSDLDVSKIVSINGLDLEITEILNKIFKDTNIGYIIKDKQIILINKESAQQDTLITISGKVIDAETSGGLPGVTIVQKGTTKGTISDFDGNYIITVTKNSTVSFSYVGYVTEEIVADRAQTRDINMIPDILSLSEVVVIGYGVVDKKDLTGAVTVVNEENLIKTPGTNINEALQGKAAGVHIVANSGTPGAGLTVRIRGVGTATNSDPLYVVDGIQMTPDEVDFLNPEDIENFSILKDASATAIYGSKGANGVVLITTKEGKAGKNKITFKYYYGWQENIRTMDMMNADEFVETWNKLATGAARIDTNTYRDVYANTNWFDEIFRVAPMQNYYLSVSGGNENSTYSVSGSYLKQDGIIINSGFQRFNLRINSSHKIKDRITIGEKLLLNRGIRDVVPENNEYESVVANAILTDPLSSPYITTEDGETYWGPTLFSNYRNPVSLAELGLLNVSPGALYANNRGWDSETQNKLLGNIFVEVELIKGLKLKSSIGLKFDYISNYDFLPEYNIEGSDLNAQSKLEKQLEETRYWNWENTATYSKKIGAHDFTALIGMTAEEFKGEYLNAINRSGPGLENEIPELRYFSYYSEDLDDRIEGSGEENAMVSYLGRLNYNYNDKYLVTLSVRRDGSSRFGTSYEKNVFNKGHWGTFPMAAAAWKISNEPFFSNVPVVSSLKVRLGWGRTGNQNIGAYRYVSSIDPTRLRYCFNQAQDSASVGAFPYYGANEAIHWETVEQTNIGLDAGLFNNKLLLSAEYFIKNTKEMLIQMPIPYIVGIPPAGAPYQNLGNVKNKGVELVIGYREMESQLKYNIDFNISYIKNEVIDLGEEGNYFELGTFGDRDATFTRTEKGKPIGAFYGYKTDGIFQNWEEINSHVQWQAVPGDIRYVDVNEDGAITPDDRVMIGNPHPDLIFGLNTQFFFKGFDLSLFFQGTYGNEIFFPFINWTHDPSPNGRNWHRDLLDAWEAPVIDEQTGEVIDPGNTDTDIPWLGVSDNDNNQWSDRMVFDGSYVRLKTVELGYNLPKNILNIFKIDNLRIYFNSKNLFTITNYIGFDPEIGRTRMEEQGGETRQLLYGIDYGLYPPSRAYLFGIQLGF